MGLTLPQIIELVAIVIAATMVGNELAVAIFVHPKLSALDDATHLQTVQPLAAVLGVVMPFWYALTLLGSLAIAFFARPVGTPGHGLALIAAGLFAIIIVYTVLLPAPINSQIARWRPESPPANWRELRCRWDRLHAFRVVMLVVALVLLIAACL